MSEMEQIPLANLSSDIHITGSINPDEGLDDLVNPGGIDVRDAIDNTQVKIGIEFKF